MLIFKVLLMWGVLLVLVVGVGALRELLLNRLLEDLLAHQLGTIIACVVLFLAIYAFTHSISLSSQQALWVGPLWLVMSAGFEFGFFHYVRKVSWSELLADYNIVAGRLLLLLWLVVLIGPYLSVRLMNK